MIKLSVMSQERLVPSEIMKNCFPYYGIEVFNLPISLRIIYHGMFCSTAIDIEERRKNYCQGTTKDEEKALFARKDLSWYGYINRDVDYSSTLANVYLL